MALVELGKLTFGAGTAMSEREWWQERERLSGTMEFRDENGRLRRVKLDAPATGRTAPGPSAARESSCPETPTPPSTPKDKRVKRPIEVKAHMSQEEHEELRAAAAERGVSVAEYLRRGAMQKIEYERAVPLDARREARKQDRGSVG